MMNYNEYLTYHALEKLLVEGSYSFEYCKYRFFGLWSDWKPISAEKVAHKMNIFVSTDDGARECPYRFRLAQ